MSVGKTVPPAFVGILPSAAAGRIGIVDLENRFRPPFAAVDPEAGEIAPERIKPGADDLAHIGQHRCVAGGILLVHHHVGAKHLCGCTREATQFGGFHDLGKPAAGQRGIQIADDLGINPVCRKLVDQVIGPRRIAVVVGDISEKFPQPGIIVGTQGVGLGLDSLRVAPDMPSAVSTYCSTVLAR